MPEQLQGIVLPMPGALFKGIPECRQQRNRQFPVVGGHLLLDHIKHEAREIVLSTFLPEIAVNQGGEVSDLGIAKIVLEHRKTVAPTYRWLFDPLASRYLPHIEVLSKVGARKCPWDHVRFTANWTD